MINAYLRCDNCGELYNAGEWICPECLRRHKKGFDEWYYEVALKGLLKGL
jgi:RNA polymerase subunit RPABC4/transcription elongation factor Spt4